MSDLLTHDRKPVLIVRHSPNEGPGHVAVFLEQHGIPFQSCNVDACAPVPHDPAAYAGLVFMCGPMSVNDDLPWIEHSLAIIRAAVERDIPVLGHCLGGQLIAKALGGVITRNPVKEIGWGRVTVLDNPTARHWFGDTQHFHAFHLHGETFSIPDGATHILESPWCAYQAYALGPHLGMQCHVEMNAAMIADWCAVGQDELSAAAASPAVQTAAAMISEAPTRLPAMTAAAEQLYSRWIEGLKP